MIVSNKLKSIFLLSIPLSIIHGIEEYITGFYATDNFSKLFFSYSNNMNSIQSSFITFQVMIWLILIISAILITKPKWQLYIMLIPGLIYIFELHHLVKAIIVFSYYPGALTAFLFPIIGFFYWQQLLKDLNLVYD